jgi:universal stress protein E
VKELRRVLVVVDPTAASHPAVEKGAHLARLARAHLELVISDYSPEIAPRHFFDAETYDVAAARYRAPHVDKLEALASPLRAQGLTVDVDVQLETPLHIAILRKIRAVEPDIVVKDTHYHTVIRRTLLTNTDWHLIRECPVPLLLVRREPWSSEAPRVGAAVDPGHVRDEPAVLDHAILDAAERLKATCGAQTFAVHVFAALRGLRAGAAQNDEWGVGRGAFGKVVQELRAARQREFERLFEGRSFAPADRFFLDGDVIETLPLFVAEQNADILVLGAVARGRAYELFVGSTAERLLDRLPCDVLIVKAVAAA